MFRVLTNITMARMACLALASIACACMAFSTSARAQALSADAATPGEAAVAEALDTIAGPGAGPYAPIIGTIEALATSAARSDALGQLSPRAYRVMPRLSIQSMDATDREIRGYLAIRRETSLDVRSSAPLSVDRTVNVLVSSGFKQGKYEGRPDRPSANFDSRSVRVAFDVAPAPGLIVGASIGIDGLDANLDRARQPRSTLFNAGITPYASYASGRFYVDATAGYTRSWYQLRRQVSWNGIISQLQAGAEGDNASASAEAGGILQLGALRAQPFAGLQYRYADLGGIVESGGAASLAVARFKSESVRSTLGLRASATLREGNWAIRPVVEGQWQRDRRAHPEGRIEATFTNGGAPIFTLPAGRYDRDAAIVGAGLSAVQGDRTAVRLSYSGEFAHDRRIHSFALTASRRF